MPWTDWQFWVVTVAAAWGAWILVRQFRPAKKEADSPCGACAVGASVEAARKHHAAASDEARTGTRS